MLDIILGAVLDIIYVCLITLKDVLTPFRS